MGVESIGFMPPKDGDAVDKVDKNEQGTDKIKSEAQKKYEIRFEKYKENFHKVFDALTETYRKELERLKKHEGGSFYKDQEINSMVGKLGLKINELYLSKRKDTQAKQEGWFKEDEKWGKKIRDSKEEQVDTRQAGELDDLEKTTKLLQELMSSSRWDGLKLMKLGIDAKTFYQPHWRNHILEKSIKKNEVSAQQWEQKWKDSEESLKKLATEGRLNPDMFSDEFIKENPTYFSQAK